MKKRHENVYLGGKKNKLVKKNVNLGDKKSQK